jgi:phage FluMu protein Com
MNLRCQACGRPSYSASPDAVIRNGIRCGECGGELARVADDPDGPDSDGGEALSGA